MKAYFISGLGADKQAFKKVKLPPVFEPVYLDWITPEKDESLSKYARRISSRIPNNDAFILIGLSFGGMIASEIATVRKPLKTIIVSSVGSYDELPWYFKGAGKMNLHNTIPIKLLKAGTFMRNMMGVHTNEDKALINHYAKKSDPEFIRWSLNAILNWDRHERIPGLIHIHGEKDHLLPLKYTHPDYTIHEGGHLMIFNKADEVNKIINEVLAVN